MEAIKSDSVQAKTLDIEMQSADSSFRCAALALRPERLRELQSLVQFKKWIPRGAGLSYTPASFGKDVVSIDLTRLNRILNFDPREGIIEVEAGVSLCHLLEFLNSKGFTLPVLPGHPNITIGGCIAQDVHGKNQFREGTFGDWVESCHLYHPRLGNVQTGAQLRPEIWDLTRAGYGLTGLILSARLKVLRQGVGAYRKRNLQVLSLHQTVEMLEKYKSEASTLYSWNDVSDPSSVGKGFLVLGSWEEGYQIQKNLYIQSTKLSPAFSILNRPFVSKTVNKMYLAAAMAQKESYEPSLLHHFPIANKWHYYRSYGKSGFFEHQVLIPFADVESYLTGFEKVRKTSECTIPMGTLKIFSGSSVGRSFQGQGIVFTWDIPNHRNGLDLLEKLDLLALEKGGRLNITKASYISGSRAREFVPELNVFQEAVRSLDPEFVLNSHFTARLDL